MIDNILLILIVLLFVLLFLYFTKNKNVNVKSPTIKKDELKDNYRNQMRELLEEHKDDKSMQIKKKILLLKQINNELSMNLFFDEIEAKEFLQELSNIN